MPDCAVNDRDEHDSNEILTSNWPFNIVSKNLSLFQDHRRSYYGLQTPNRNPDKN